MSRTKITLYFQHTCNVCFWQLFHERVGYELLNKRKRKKLFYWRRPKNTKTRILSPVCKPLYNRLYLFMVSQWKLSKLHYTMIKLLIISIIIFMKHIILINFSDLILCSQVSYWERRNTDVKMIDVSTGEFDIILETCQQQGLPPCGQQNHEDLCMNFPCASPGSGCCPYNQNCCRKGP